MEEAIDGSAGEYFRKLRLITFFRNSTNDLNIEPPMGWNTRKARSANGETVAAASPEMGLSL